MLNSRSNADSHVPVFNYLLVARFSPSHGLKFKKFVKVGLSQAPRDRLEQIDRWLEKLFIYQVGLVATWPAASRREARDNEDRILWGFRDACLNRLERSRLGLSQTSHRCEWLRMTPELDAFLDIMRSKFPPPLF
jgi:hypothetical protein